MQLSERDGLELWRKAVTASVRSDAPDLTARQQAVLMTIALTPGPHTVRGLAEHLGIAKPAVTRALDALERLDFIRRLPDDTDLRSIFVERTPAGMSYLRAFARLVLAAASGGRPQGRLAHAGSDRQTPRPPARAGRAFSGHCRRGGHPRNARP
ncbi:MAG: MarR family transcriptional regulator [Hyphomonas sp. 32-62-5]|nr:MAG: MarR family transcriptional regulator [Hyphomonas sp. 32-62-5]